MTTDKYEREIYFRSGNVSCTMQWELTPPDGEEARRKAIRRLDALMPDAQDFMTRSIAKLPDADAADRLPRMRRTKVYISGPITGVPDAARRFKKAALALQEKGYAPVNPMEDGLPPEAPWTEHMREDIRLLTGCDALCLLEGWQDSPGARLEEQVARAIGLRAIPLPETDPDAPANERNE